MKELRLMALLLASVLVFTSCDLFRMMAGRPTSKDIEAKKELIAKEQKLHQDRLDSLKLMQKHISDSLAVLDSIRMSNSSLVSVRQLSPESRKSLSHRYYVIVGAFGKPENAEKSAANARESGYEPTLITYQNGFVAVGVNPSDRLTDAYSALSKVRDSGFCPDAWILDNK